MRKLLLIFFIVFSFHHSFSRASIFGNQQLMDSVEVCVNYIYNCQFDEAEPMIDYINQSAENHPIGPFLYGMKIYWQNFPLTPDNHNSISFIDSLARCIKLARPVLEENRNNAEYTLLSLTSHALLMMYYADNGLYRGVLEHVYPAYKMIMRSFELREKNDEFNFYTGLYNYYRQEYAKAHPVYRPALYFLKKGSTERGLEQLEYTAHNCFFMDTEAYQFLVIIYLNYENNPKEALKYVEEVYQLNTNNPFFLSRYIELKMLAKDTASIEPLLDKLFAQMGDRQFYQMLAYIYKGMYEELYNQNYTIAQYDYKKGLRLAKKYKTFADNFKAYAYLGLHRIYKQKANDEMAEKYADLAEEVADYEYYYNDM